MKQPSRMSTLVDRAPEAAVRSRDMAQMTRQGEKTAAFFGDYQRRSSAIGQALTWLCGGALAFNLLLVIAILLLLVYYGLGYFWQKDLVELTLKDGRKVLGEVWEVEQVPA